MEILTSALDEKWPEVFDGLCPRQKMVFTLASNRINLVRQIDFDDEYQLPPCKPVNLWSFKGRPQFEKYLVIPKSKKEKSVKNHLYIREYFKYVNMRVRQLREWAENGIYTHLIFIPDYSTEGTKSEEVTINIPERMFL